MSEILSFENYTFTYHRYDSKNGQALCDNAPALSHIQLQIQSGDWILLCGHTGSGKTTLLRSLKESISLPGSASGSIFLKQKELSSYSEKEQARQIAYLSQHPQDQCVTDTVAAEISFGLENMGTPPEVIQQKVAETLSYFHLEHLLHKRTAELSGGQLQLLNLASLLVMDPEILLLDEPTAQLDPPSEREFLATLRRLHQETGITILMAEHNFGNTLSECNRMVVMDRGQIALSGSVREVLSKLPDTDTLYDALPLSYRISRVNASSGEGVFSGPEDVPLSVGEGRNYLSHLLQDRSEVPLPVFSQEESKAAPDFDGFYSSPKSQEDAKTQAALQIKEVWFRYAPKGPDVLKGISATFCPGKIYGILGSNGSGKSTLFALLSGHLKPQDGKIKYTEMPALLPQDPETLILTDSLDKEVALQEKTLQDLPTVLQTYPGNTHPYDLSGGEKQLLALWKILHTGRRILLLDEPQKGLDASQRKLLMTHLRSLRSQGYTLLLVTHDTDFAAEICDTCQMLCGGALTQPLSAKDFFTINHLYTSATSRLTRGIYPGLYREQELFECCKAII